MLTLKIRVVSDCQWGGEGRESEQRSSFIVAGKEGNAVCLVLEILPWTMRREVQISHRQLDLESRGEYEEDWSRRHTLESSCT